MVSISLQDFAKELIEIGNQFNKNKKARDQHFYKC
ncbi:hypothetical protein CMALT394_70011 [Carnobacterium maltaromaticum]|nr:hypothetical protein CMALT394_70011 [Carnobacterium maltaromaticum]